MPIRILDAATVGRIAAGEVVERPASVLKELLENAIDAGATAITVEIKGGGIDYLRVTDNGCGIEPNQVRLAFENHATSKLQSAEQLDDIRTLGFRGEALPSIASVSHVEMTTRARGQDTGVRLNIDGGGAPKVQEAGCPEGTTIVVKDLFYNLPVRRAFLKKPAYEGGLVGDVAARMILANPKVSMRYLSNGQTVYHSFGDGSLRHAVFAVYGKQTAEQMVELDAAEGGVHIYGLIGVGELAKSSRAHQAFFINGRVVRCATLTRALEEVCRTRVTIGLYPMCALNVVIPPYSVNVNVHPNKLEVRFKDEVAMRQTADRLMATAFEGERVLQLEMEKLNSREVEAVREVRQVLPEAKPASPTPKFVDKKTAYMYSIDRKYIQYDSGWPDMLREDTGPSRQPDVLREDTGPRYRLEVSGEDTDLSRLSNRPREDADFLPALPVRKQKESATPFDDPFCQSERENPAEPSLSVPETVPPAVEEPTKPTRPEQLSIEQAAPEATAAPCEYRVIGVLMKTYILIEANDALVMIDQHAAHERLNYEKLMAQVEAGQGAQQLLTPMVLRLSAREMALVQENVEALYQAGYEIEPFGEKDIQVRSVPYILGKADLKPAFMDALSALSRVKNAAIDLRRAEIMQMACKSAVKGGDPLTDSEVEALVRQMLETGAPPTCPHGRPVMKALSRRELEKLFKRIQ